MSSRFVLIAVFTFCLAALPQITTAAEQVTGPPPSAPTRASEHGDSLARPPHSKPTPQQASFFENRIRPLLAERCWECHNEDVQESDLRLDSLQAMMDGGERGPAIIPGDAENSLLIHALNHSEADLQMPEGEKLASRQIRDMAKWIDDGAVWPGQQAQMRRVEADAGVLFADEEKAFWAFVPPVRPNLPAVQNEAWVKSDLDRFILAKLEAQGLGPAPPASRRALIRRAYFDLLGLPPTTEPVAAFLADDSPGAFERVVDRLLASPQYGERWGRHWLDVARYADSNGLDENWAFEFIYKYRDWVIGAFNDDLSYDTFVTHQLAGDLIPQSRQETLADYIHRVEAAGFLSVGPKMIADDDPKKKKMDIIDEQLSTVCQTFMALTVGCARCHDHKFDPIPTWDYYALAGIFKSTKTMEHLRVVAPVSLHEFKPDGYDRKLQAYEAKLDELIRRRNAFWQTVARAAYDKDNAANSSEKPADEKTRKDGSFELPENADRWVPQEKLDKWRSLQARVKAHEKTKPQLVKVMAPTEGTPEDLRVSLRGNYLTLGSQTHRQFLRIIEGEQPRLITGSQSGRHELARWLTQENHPLTSRVLVNRVWRWRFGRGIVSTTDNFGRLGERPTHPGLLDWLAVSFVQDDDWSVKKLHKRMMLSATYQMSTKYDPRGADTDPENRLWWRFPRRRLEAEVIRDTILAVSDNLDLEMGGSLMTLKDRSYVTGTASKTQDYDNSRRSVYQPVYRSAVYDVLTAFDFPDPATPSGDRHDSVVAPQALLMMNSGLVADAALRMAEWLLAELESDRQRIDALYERSISRLPTEQERIAILVHLEQTRALLGHAGESAQSNVEVQAWQGICRTMISSNEFLYLD